ncbi:MAG: hypothetical protein M1469_01260 [Bacteroidetes bacterium]|nr:hypothetical protein [Bacteroidota bacterium]
MTDTEYTLLGKLTEAEAEASQLEGKLRSDAEELKTAIESTQAAFFTDNPSGIGNMAATLVSNIAVLQTARTSAATLRAQLYPPPADPTAATTGVV